MNRMSGNVARLAVLCAVVALPMVACAHDSSYGSYGQARIYLPAPAPIRHWQNWQHRNVHSSLDYQHEVAHAYNPYMTRWQHKRLHRALRSQHREYHTGADDHRSCDHSRRGW